MYKTLVKSIVSNVTLRSFCSAPVPNLIPVTDKYPSKFQSAREIWIENFNTVEEQKQGILQLHPDVFATAPRIDVIHQNVSWQRKYRYVSFAHAATRAELPGGGRKPWPQKGMGRARHGSIRSPLFKGGGRAHGPRSPTSHFYMLPFFTRVLGLTSTLSVKLAQDDLHVINDLEIPTEDPEFIRNLIAERKWGPSVLLIDTDDIVPRNIAIATENIQHVNILPAYGLNVYSMLKYETLAITVRAVKHIEDKILYHLNRNDSVNLMQKFKVDHQ